METRASFGPRLGKLPVVRPAARACCFRRSSRIGSTLESRSSRVRKRESGERNSATRKLLLGSADLNSSFRKHVAPTKDSRLTVSDAVCGSLYFFLTYSSSLVRSEFPSTGHEVPAVAPIALIAKLTDHTIMIAARKHSAGRRDGKLTVSPRKR